ncbi:hypothetical protein F2K82_12110 [Vibrio cholerae]|nr:hypothetical protein [Vibrio cholerae]EGQ9638158.1 hypothetical protein [Vibrio cholerae]
MSRGLFTIEINPNPLSLVMMIIPFLLEAVGGGYVRSPQSHSLSMLMGMNSLAAYLQLQVVWV